MTNPKRCNSLIHLTSFVWNMRKVTHYKYREFQQRGLGFVRSNWFSSLWPKSIIFDSSPIIFLTVDFIFSKKCHFQHKVNRIGTRLMSQKSVHLLLQPSPSFYTQISSNSWALYSLFIISEDFISLIQSLGVLCLRILSN